MKQIVDVFFPDAMASIGNFYSHHASFGPCTNCNTTVITIVFDGIRQQIQQCLFQAPPVCENLQILQSFQTDIDLASRS